VRHHYTSSSDETLIKSQYDLYYIKHQCVTLDVYILLMTVVEMFLLRGR
jgi:lipopolysaccharide/colanic/teichoic acid biosynthesis glycosyltransferase